MKFDPTTHMRVKPLQLFEGELLGVTTSGKKLYTSLWTHFASNTAAQIISRTDQLCNSAKVVHKP
jgi:hypothetical protein